MKFLFLEKNIIAQNNVLHHANRCITPIFKIPSDHLGSICEVFMIDNMSKFEYLTVIVFKFETSKIDKENKQKFNPLFIHETRITKHLKRL